MRCWDLEWIALISVVISSHSACVSAQYLEGNQCLPLVAIPARPESRLLVVRSVVNPALALLIRTTIEDLNEAHIGYDPNPVRLQRNRFRLIKWGF